MQAGSAFLWTHRALVAVALLGALAGCGPRRATGGAAEAMPTPPPPRPTVRTLRVVAVVDEAWRRLPQFEARVRAVVEGASAFAAGEFGLVLKLEKVAPWPGADGLEGARLDALERAVPAPGADLVVGFTATPPPRRPRMAELAPSRYAGRHAVVHGLGRYFDDPAALRAAEVRALLNALGRIYGALPSCHGGVMAPQPTEFPASPAAWRWGPTNRTLVAAHAPIDLRPARTDEAASRVPAAVAERARRVLMRPGPDLQCALDAVDARRALLAAVMSAAQAADATPDTLLPDGEAQAEDAVEAAERDLEADPAAAFEVCRPIADAAPAVAARCAGRASEALGLHDDAVRYYRAWLAHHPDDEAVVLRLAREVGRDGDDEAARALLARAVEAHPDFVEARLNLGIALARLGRYAEAAAAWRAVLARDPDHAEARRLLDELARSVAP